MGFISPKVQQPESILQLPNFLKNDKIIKFTYIILGIVITSCTEHKKEDLGSNYSIITSASSYNDCLIVFDNSIVVVSGHVLDADYNSKFIVAVKYPRDSIIAGKEMTSYEYRTMLERNKLRLYWIIDKSKELTWNGANELYSNVYGPFSRNELLQKVNELNMPDSLIH